MSESALKNKVKVGPPRLISGEELLRMDDLGPCELVRGRVVLAQPSYPAHGLVEVNFASELRAFVKPRRLGKVLGGEVGVYTGRDPDTVRGGDVVFVSTERYACWKKERKKGFFEIAPDLVVEILSGSPGSKRIVQKIEEYFSIGVRRVWIASLARQTVRVHRAPRDFRAFGVRDVLEDDELLPGFRVPVRELFV